MARAAHLAYFAVFDGPRGRGRPLSADSWDAQWQQGKWDYLESAPELARYALIAGYVKAVTTAPTLLDVGCGHGELVAALGEGAVKHYHGIDVSNDAIERAARRGFRDATFEAADLTEWTSLERYDVVVINEVLYYVRDPSEQVARYLQMVRPGGALVISMFRHGNTRLIWRELRRRFTVVDGAEVKNGLGEIVEVNLLLPD